jgi:hypothetical protein
MRPPLLLWAKKYFVRNDLLPVNCAIPLPLRGLNDFEVADGRFPAFFAGRLKSRPAKNALRRPRACVDAGAASKENLRTGVSRFDEALPIGIR